MANDYIAPKAPAHLKAPGRRLWVAVTEAYALRPDEQRVLENACRLTDESERLRRDLDKLPTMVPGSKGQTRPNPLFAELRAHRLAQAKLLQQLGLDDVAANNGMERSAAGRRMARIRWG